MTNPQERLRERLPATMLRTFFKKKAQEPGESISSALQISYVLKHQEILYQKEKHVQNPK